METLALEISRNLKHHPSIDLSLEELRKTLMSIGLELEPGKREGEEKALRVTTGKVDAQDPETFSIRMTEQRDIEIKGASPIGTARGIGYLEDRIEVLGKLPSLDLAVTPAFPRRFIYVGVGSLDVDTEPYVEESRYDSVLSAAEAEIRAAFRFGANHVILPSNHRIASWTQPPQCERTDVYRRLYSEMARISHRYGMKAITIGDEFLYEDQALEAEGVRLSPEDDSFWQFLQDRYRGILDNVPDLDGIGVRIGEMLPRGSIKAFDVIHNDSDLSIEEKYRRFVRAMYKVVAEEHEKLYYHRTWVVNDWEQHSVPSIFRSIFREIPTQHLVVSIKLTKCDQWWYQAFNPNFGQTPHATSVELEMHHGPHGSMAYPDYMGEWFQAGLNYALGRGATAIVTGMPTNLWMSAHHYAAHRLAWDPRIQPGELAEDWAAKVFGRPARRKIARMLLLSDDAMRKALYIKPYASTQAWNPLSHVMTGMFVVEGEPLIDRGAAHAKFLRELYLVSKPQFEETLEEMSQGLEIYDEMLRLYSQARPRIKRKLGGEAGRSIRNGRSFLAANVAYVTAFMNFFRYEEEGTDRSRRAAARSLRRLKKALGRYMETPGSFDPLGIETFIGLADQGLSDLEAYRSRLEEAPNEFEKEEILSSARKTDEKLVTRPSARKILYFEADVDGAELVIVRGRELSTRHLADEMTVGIRYEFCEPLPKGGFLAIRPIEVRGWAYVAEQPSPENGHTGKILVLDPQDGRSVYRFELYWIPRGKATPGGRK